MRVWNFSVYNFSCHFLEFWSVQDSVFYYLYWCNIVVIYPIVSKQLNLSGIFPNGKWHGSVMSKFISGLMLPDPWYVILVSADYIFISLNRHFLSLSQTTLIVRHSMCLSSFRGRFILYTFGHFHSLALNLMCTCFSGQGDQLYIWCIPWPIWDFGSSWIT